MSTAQATDVAGRSLDALAGRDFDAIVATFAEDAVLHALVPSRVRDRRLPA